MNALARFSVSQPVLVNLVGNATKFTERGGIEIKATRQQESSNADTCVVQFVVIDSGIGIAESDMHKVLAPFGQVDSAMAREHEGTGLGIPQRRQDLLGSRARVPEQQRAQKLEAQFPFHVQCADMLEFMCQSKAQIAWRV